MSEYLFIVKYSIDSHDMFASMRACVRACVSACTTLNMILIKIDRMLRQIRSWLTVEELRKTVHLLINLKDTFFDMAVGPLPNLARMCG